MKLQQQLTAMTRHVATTLIVAAGTMGVAQAGTVTVVPNVVTITGASTNPTVTGAINTVNVSDVVNNVSGNANFSGNYYYGFYSNSSWKLEVDVPAVEGIVKSSLSGTSPTQTYAAPYDSSGNPITGYYLSTGGYGASTSNGPLIANAPSSVYNGSTALGSANSTGDIKLSFTTAQSYFGLLWGSIDASNVLSFYNGTTLLGTITGTQALQAAAGLPGFTGAGCQVAGCSEYFLVNFLAGQTYTSVVFGNTGSAAPSFEAANFQYATSNVPGTTTVPEPASAALLGVGLAGLFAARRRRA